jgi:arylsulfatase A-like enzyme
MADDMGAKELSCYGNTEHNTPNLDRLGETGVRFETCFATPICHPTRAMIMTGQYGCHNGIYNFAGRRGGPDSDSPVEDIGANHVTFAQILKPRGYATALAGKWQLSGKVPSLVYECGFDEYCIWAYKHNLPEGVEHTGGWEGPTKTSRYWNPCILRNGKYTPTKPDDYGPDIYTDFLIDFMRRHKEQPFFLYYPMCLTHGPHLPTPDNVTPDSDRYKGEEENYKGTVEYTDKLIGRLVKALDDLGLRENTILFFTGDNGTARSGKSQPTELGARVPGIVSCPGIVKTRGGTCELTDLSDILPTLADFAGAEVPSDRPIDGHSLAPFLRGGTETTRDWIFSYIADRRILRTQRWLLEDNSPLHWGKLYDCGDSRDGNGYKEVTRSDSPEVAAIEKRFKDLLADLPSPILPEEGSTREEK